MNTPKISEPLAYSIAEACFASRLSRTTIYASIKVGELPLLKHGKRSLILRSDLLAFLESKKQPAPAAEQQNAG
jgi:excisionase family DNA binding protein